jgi:GDP-L-fucose synthase
VVNLNSTIFVSGHRGMVGSAIVRKLNQLGYGNIILRAREELDLTNQSQVNKFFEEVKPDYVYLAAAKVGGIHANNTYPAEFIYQNLMIEANIIHASFLNNVSRLIFLGSSCIYPKYASQPINEDALLTGQLESTNEPYAVAKIAGIKLCESYNRQYGTDYRSLMPTNLYGPGDNYHPENSHVIPALIRRFHQAKNNKAPNVVVWGSGNVFREFLHVDDLANYIVQIMGKDHGDYRNSDGGLISVVNLGSGEEISIRDLAFLIKDIVGYSGEIIFDMSKPDGTPRKLLDISLLSSLCQVENKSLRDGLVETYSDFLASVELS